MVLAYTEQVTDWKGTRLPVSASSFVLSISAGTKKVPSVHMQLGCGQWWSGEQQQKAVRKESNSEAKRQ